MLKLIAKFRKDEEGATAIEYALIAAIIAIGIIASLGSVKSALNAKFTTISTAVSATY